MPNPVDVFVTLLLRLLAALITLLEMAGLEKRINTPKVRGLIKRLRR